MREGTEASNPALPSPGHCAPSCVRLAVAIALGRECYFLLGFTDGETEVQR